MSAPDNDRATATGDVVIPVTAEDVAALLDSARRTADELCGHHEDSALRGFFLRVAGLLVAMRNALRAEHERLNWLATNVCEIGHFADEPDSWCFTFRDSRGFEWHNGSFRNAIDAARAAAPAPDAGDHHYGEEGT